MKDKLKRLISRNKYVLLFVVFFIVFTSIKVTPLSNSEFLLEYPYLTSDSLDWVSNAENIFKSNQISFRNPGLVFLIKGLRDLGIFNLIPYINHLFLLLLIIFSYKTCRRYSEKIALFIGALIFCNFAIQNFAHYILSDLYAITFICISLYFLLSKRYFISVITLIPSLYFQNFGYFLLAMLLAHIVLPHIKDPKQYIRLVKQNFYRIILIGILLLPIGLHYIYKYFALGDLLNSGLVAAQFDLISPNLDSGLYYFVNIISIFGFLGIVIPIFYFFYTIINRNSITYELRILIFYLIFSFTFWFILYDWNDRRFILYSIPAFYPLFAHFLSLLNKHFRLLYLLPIALITFVPTFMDAESYALDNRLSFGNFNIVFESYRYTGAVKQTDIRLPAVINSDKTAIYLVQLLQNELAIPKARFKAYFLDVQKYYNKEKNELCLPNLEAYNSRYALNSVSMILTGSDYTKLSANCEVKTQ